MPLKEKSNNDDDRTYGRNSSRGDSSLTVNIAYHSSTVPLVIRIRFDVTMNLVRTRYFKVHVPKALSKQLDCEVILDYLRYLWLPEKGGHRLESSSGETEDEVIWKPW